MGVDGTTADHGVIHRQGQPFPVCDLDHDLFGNGNNFGTDAITRKH